MNTAPRETASFWRPAVLVTLIAIVGPEACSASSATKDAATDSAGQNMDGSSAGTAGPGGRGAGGSAGTSSLGGASGGGSTGTAGLGGGGTGGSAGTSGAGGAAGSTVVPTSCKPPCPGGQLCVFPSCGQQCSPLSTGAACAPNQPTCVPPQGGLGCTLPLRCTTPPPFCANLPAGCTTCACLPSDICQGHGKCMYLGVGFNPADSYVSCSD